MSFTNSTVDPASATRFDAVSTAIVLPWIRFAIACAASRSNGSITRAKAVSPRYRASVTGVRGSPRNASTG